jgi:hypothetical protein
MADIISDGRTRVAWVSSIANKAAPTVAELNAGMLLHSFMTDDGLSGFRPGTNNVPNRKLDSTFNTVDVGSVTAEDTLLRLYKQDGVDTIYDTLIYRLSGFVVIRRSLLASDAWAAGQKPQVWPARCGEVAWLDPEADTEERYEVPVKIIDQPELRALVAA